MSVEGGRGGWVGEWERGWEGKGIGWGRKIGKERVEGERGRRGGKMQCSRRWGEGGRGRGIGAVEEKGQIHVGGRE